MNIKQIHPEPLQFTLLKHVARKSQEFIQEKGEYLLKQQNQYKYTVEELAVIVRI